MRACVSVCLCICVCVCVCARVCVNTKCVTYITIITAILLNAVFVSLSVTKTARTNRQHVQNLVIRMVVDERTGEITQTWYALGQPSP